MNIKSYWFPHCPPHPHPTGSTECGPGTPPAGRGLLLNPVLSSATPLSHPPADFSSVKGNQNYIKIAHSNWNIYLFSQHHFFCQKIFFRGLSKRRGWKLSWKNMPELIHGTSLSLWLHRTLSSGISIFSTLFHKYKHSHPETHKYKYSLSPLSNHSRDLIFSYSYKFEEHLFFKISTMKISRKASTSQKHFSNTVMSKVFLQLTLHTSLQNFLTQ